MISLSLALLVLLVRGSHAAYVLKEAHSGKTFFDAFNFFTAPDPTHGSVTYVSQDVATSKQLISVNPQDQVYIGVDTTTYGGFRDSVRLESKELYTRGLFVLDLAHMPYGCGSWPAFWTYGDNWPNNGEIDIIEQVHNPTANIQTLHTGSGCAMPPESSSSFTGTWLNTNCDVRMTDNAGCGVLGSAGSFGEGFNANGGGVYAMDWTNELIRVFVFSRDQSPSDVNSANPNPSSWGKPVGQWTLGSNCPSNKFQNHKIVFNIAFCGDWAGAVWSSSCPQYSSTDCVTFVASNPEQFQETYWLVNYLNIYEQAEASDEL